MSNDRPPPREIFASDIITIQVGPTADKFCVHKALLMHYSGYFRGVLGSGNFKEGTTRVVTLKDIDTYTFMAFVNWLYSERLPDCYDWHWKFPDNPEENVDMTMTRVYIFADRFLVPAMANCVMRAIFRGIDDFPEPEVVTLAFNNLPEDSPLLRIFVDAYCLSWCPEGDDIDWYDIGELPIKFYKRIAFRMASTRNGGLGKLKYSDYAEPDVEGVESDE